MRCPYVRIPMPGSYVKQQTSFVNPWSERSRKERQTFTRLASVRSGFGRCGCGRRSAELQFSTCLGRRCAGQRSERLASARRAGSASLRSQAPSRTPSKTLAWRCIQHRQHALRRASHQSGTQLSSYLRHGDHLWVAEPRVWARQNALSAPAARAALGGEGSRWVQYLTYSAPRRDYGRLYPLLSYPNYFFSPQPPDISRKAPPRAPRRPRARSRLATIAACSDPGCLDCERIPRFDLRSHRSGLRRHQDRHAARCRMTA